MRNGTLYSLLREVVLNWIGQLDIARLQHGCHPPIIHQNICSNVIVFVEDLDARIMDFGLASVMTFDDVSKSRFVDGNLEEIRSFIHYW